MTDETTQRIIGAAIEVHRILGHGLLESIYESALCLELNMRNIKYERQAYVDVVYKKTIIKGQRIDLLVENRVVVELKSTSKITEILFAQTLSYPKSNRIETGSFNKF